MERFKGYTATLEFAPDRTIIRGTNKARKTTTNTATSWCMTGADLNDRSNYRLYDETIPFDRENAQTVSVETIWDIDGVERSFKRVAKQKWEWVGSKGEYRKAKADEYTYYVDGLAVPAKSFKDAIEGIFGSIDKLKLMLNPRYYLSLDWKVLRKHFADMVGIIDESELKGDYSKIADLLKIHKTNDAVKAKLKQQLEPILRDINTIDAKIKGQKETLPDLDGVEDAKRQIAGKKARVAEIDNEILGLGEANMPYVEKRHKEEEAIRNRKIALDGERGVWEEAQNEPIWKIQQQIREIGSENDIIRKENERISKQRISLKQDIDRSENLFEIINDNLVKLREQNKQLKAVVFDENQSCPNCGQPLPYDKVAEIREKFYERNAEQRTDIVAQGKRLAEQVANLEKTIAEKKEQLSALPDPKPLLSLDELEAQLSLAKSNVVPFEQSDIYDKLTKEIFIMETYLTVVPEVDSAELVAEKSMLTNEIGELQKIVAKETQYNSVKATIAQNEASKAPLGVERSRLDGLIAVCVERDREYASIVRDRANKYLEYAQVEMIELNKGGDVTDICKLSARNVSADSQNNETQINIGVDVARAFQKNLGVNLPIFIDNAEGIVDANLPKCDNQLILFYVDERFPTMVIEGSEEYCKRLDYINHEEAQRAYEREKEDEGRRRFREQVLDALID